jgi:uncharacterized membrane protein YvlD (DUF360 family)
MNFFLRPLLNLVTLPLHLIATLATTMIVHVLFLWLVYRITLLMDPTIIALTITGGVMGWIIVGSLLGLMNWLMKHVL